MGLVVRCRVEHRDDVGIGKAMLETAEIVFRGDFRVVIPFREIRSVDVRDGCLTVKWPGGPTMLHLGAAADKWAQKLLHPKSLHDKLGVRDGDTVSVLGVQDRDFLQPLRDRPVELSVGRSVKESDLIFLAADERKDLDKLTTLQKYLKPAGAIWVVRPRGTARISEGDVMAAGKAAGLVDTKVVRFSDTHTAEKLVIPVARRSR